MEAAARNAPSFWPTDEHHDGSSSSSSSSSSNASLEPPPLAPAPTTAQLQELSAFLAASGDHPPVPGALSSTLLDELLGANDDLDLVPGTRAAAMSLDDGPLDTDARLGPAQATARLLQLEDNYERKKKRAKINRKDLNARFQELMELLQLREDRKLNRAKVLEKAIERIEGLTAELAAAKVRLGSVGASLPPSVTQNSSRKPTTAVPIALPARHSSAGLRHHAMVPIAAGTSPWGAGAGSAVPLASMVWLPCSMVSHHMPASLAVDASAGRSGGVGTSSKRRRLERVDSEPGSAVDEPMDAQEGQTSGGPSANWDAQPAVASAGASSAVWAALEVPAVLQFCDAWALASVMQTCKELRTAARREDLWVSLSQRRWRVPARNPQLLPARQQWIMWHAANRMPDCSSITSAGFHFATGRRQNVSAWGLLSRRSNGRTTRTVLVGGRAAVMQVVELYVVVQNMGSARVRLTDRIAVSSGGDGRRLAAPFTIGSGAHLTPHVVAVNASLCTMAGVAGVELLHGDAVVLSVFLHCQGLDLEDEFLQRAGQLHVQVETEAPRGCRKVLEIQAQCHAANDQGGQQHKHDAVELST